MQYFCRRCGAAVIFIYLTILCCEASDDSAQRTPRKPFVHNAQFWRRIFYTYTSCTNMTAKYPAAAEIPIFFKILPPIYGKTVDKYAIRSYNIL